MVTIMASSSTERMRAKRERLALQGLAEYPISVVITAEQKAAMNKDKLADLKAVIAEWFISKENSEVQQ